MANQSYLDLKDELDDEDNPYSSISARQPLEDVLDRSANSNDTTNATPAVKDFIKNRIAQQSAQTQNPNDSLDSIQSRLSGLEQDSGGSPSSDSEDDQPSLLKAPIPAPKPGAKDSSRDYGGKDLLDQYNKDQADLEDFRRAKVGSDYINNLGQAASIMARGTQGPGDSAQGFYQSLSKQNQDLMSSKELDSDRRRKVMDAIEQRKTRIDVANDRSKDRALQYSANAANRQSQADQKLTDRQNSTNQQVIARLTGSRASQDVQQAYKDRYASSKLNELFSQYGDLNKLSPQDVNLAISEVAKIASGGAPDDHTLKMLSPQSFQGTLATAYQKWSNTPSEANAGAFLKHYKDYADGLTSNANKLINDRIGKDLEASRSAIGDDNYKTNKSQFLPQDEPKAAALQAAPSSGHAPGDLVKVKGKMYKVGADGDTLEDVI